MPSPDAVHLGRDLAGDAVMAELPAAAARIDRRALYEEGHCAIEAAVQELKHPPERRLAEREAILRTLERHGLVTRTRGRRPLQPAKAEGVS